MLARKFAENLIAKKRRSERALSRFRPLLRCVMKSMLARLRGGGCGASKPSDSPAQGAPPRAQAQAKKLKLKYVKLKLPKGAPDSHPT